MTQDSSESEHNDPKESVCFCSRILMEESCVRWSVFSVCVVLVGKRCWLGWAGRMRD